MSVWPTVSGQVVETLPAGFSYVEDSAASTGANAVIDAEVDGQTITFTVVGVDSFTYRVTVGSDVADGSAYLLRRFGEAEWR